MCFRDMIPFFYLRVYTELLMCTRLLMYPMFGVKYLVLRGGLNMRKKNG